MCVPLPHRSSIEAPPVLPPSPPAEAPPRVRVLLLCILVPLPRRCWSEAPLHPHVANQTRRIGLACLHKPSPPLPSVSCKRPPSSKAPIPFLATVCILVPLHRRRHRQKRPLPCVKVGLQSIASLPNLRVPWASRAVFEGVIPSNWGAYENLEVDNLGQNLFIGEIPKGFLFDPWRACTNFIWQV